MAKLFIKDFALNGNKLYNCVNCYRLSNSTPLNHLKIMNRIQVYYISIVEVLVDSEVLGNKVFVEYGPMKMG